jgi:hypothetical protein
MEEIRRFDLDYLGGEILMIYYNEGNIINIKLSPDHTSFINERG